MFASVLSAYGKQIGNEWPGIRRRLDEGETRYVNDRKETDIAPSVRLRGRKRSMVG